MSDSVSQVRTALRLARNLNDNMLESAGLDALISEHLELATLLRLINSPTAAHRGLFTRSWIRPRAPLDTAACRSRPVA
jgi:hypothetical protein